MTTETAKTLRRTLRLLSVLLPMAVAVLTVAYFLPGWIYSIKEETAGTDAQWQKKLTLAQLDALNTPPPPVPPPELPPMAVPQKPQPPPQIQKEVVIRPVPVPVPVPVPAPAPPAQRPPSAPNDNNVFVRNAPSTPSTVVNIPPATPVTAPAVPVTSTPPAMTPPQLSPTNPPPNAALPDVPATNQISTNMAQAVAPPIRTSTTNNAARTNPQPQSAQASALNPATTGRGFTGPQNLPMPPASLDIIRLSIP